MNEGDVVLTPIPQADGKTKLRPAILLRNMPGAYRDVLVCGVSTQLQSYVEQFDETITNKDSDYRNSGLLANSLIRLGFLAVLPRRAIAGSIGSISSERYMRLLKRLSDYLIKSNINE